MWTSSGVACVAGVRKEGNGERRASEAREDRTWEEHFDFSLSHFLRPSKGRLPPEGIPNIPVRRNRNGRFIWIPTEISRIFGIMGSTLSQVGVPKEAATQARLRDSHNHLKKPDCETREIRTILNETRGFWKTNRTRGNRHCYLTFNMALVATLCTSWVFSFFSYTL